MIHICDDTPPKDNDWRIPSFTGKPASPHPFCCWKKWLEDRESEWAIIDGQ